jgi:hypothetical protein
MSDISTARATIKSWLSRLVRIDEWDLDSPYNLLSPASTTLLPLPACTAIELPVKDLQYVRTDQRSITGSGVFTYQVTYRYPGQLTFHQLPLGRAELLQQYLAAQSLLQLGGCGGLISVEPDINEYPVAVQREEEQQGDWFVRVVLVLLIDFSLTDFLLPPEYGPIDGLPEDITPLQQLNLQIYRAVPGFDTEKPADYTRDANIILEDT